MIKEKEIWKPLTYSDIIPDRYKISSYGRVMQLYKITNNGLRYKISRIIKPYFNLNNKVGSQCVSLYNGKKMKICFLSTIMVDIFKIKKPDNNNLYKLVHKDGNNLNYSLDNLSYTKFTIRKYKYDPKNIYKDGILVKKICGKCGKEKEIKNFSISSRYKQKTTYKNICYSCSGKQQWKKIRSSPELFEKVKQKTYEWAKSDAGKKYYRDYDKKYRKKLANSYVKQIIRNSFKSIPTTMITKEFINIYKIHLITKAKLKDYANTSKLFNRNA